MEMTQHNATQFTRSNGYDTVVYKGEFGYNSFGEVQAGRLDGLVSHAGSHLSGIASNLGLDIQTLSGLGGDQQAVAEYMLSGNDHIITSNLPDYIRGFTGNDTINGNGGNDVLRGEQGHDRLFGGNGADTLSGGTAGDFMAGGNGNDRYVVDNANDRVQETVSGAYDSIFSSVSRGLEANVEAMYMTGIRASWAVGNGLDNMINGNTINNAIAGGAGSDWIWGQAGNDRIVGGQGVDHLWGDGGVDTFVFRESAGLDYIEDFETGVDHINLSGIDANVFGLGDQEFVFIGNTEFSGLVAGELKYDGNSLSGDVNGDAVADFEISLTNHSALAESDMLL
jgi:serralysin